LISRIRRSSVLCGTSYSLTGHLTIFLDKKKPPALAGGFRIRCGFKNYETVLPPAMVESYKNKTRRRLISYPYSRIYHK